METVEDSLLANKLPLPQHFDGQNWNTVTSNTRRSIPSYLKGELPSMKCQRVIAKFR